MTYYYEKLGLLGEGGYGSVYEAKPKDSDKSIAIKNPFRKFSRQVTGITCFREIDYLSSFDCQHTLKRNKILHYYPFTSRKVIQDKDGEIIERQDMLREDIYITMPLAKFTLHDLVRDAKNIELSHILRAAYQMICGLYYIHSNGIIHRDFKPLNVLCYYNSGVLQTKICDFGMAIPHDHKTPKNDHVVTRYYRAPELILGYQYYDYSIDIWSLGCSLYEIFTGRTLIKADTDEDQIYDIIVIRGHPDKNYMKKYKNKHMKSIIAPEDIKRKRTYENIRSYITMKRGFRKQFDKDMVGELKIFGTYDEYVYLIDRCLQLDPEDRPSAWECLNFDCFSDIPEIDTDPDKSGLYGLVKQKKIKKNYHVLEKSDRGDRLYGYEVIKGLIAYESYEKYDILFLAVDLYDRLLMRVDPDYDSVELACICSYIAIKYYVDELTEPYGLLFPDSEKYIVDEEIEMLKILDYKIYRPTVFSLVSLSIEETYPMNLFDVMMVNEEIYKGFTIDEIARVYEQNISTSENIDNTTSKSKKNVKRNNNRR